MDEQGTGTVDSGSSSSSSGPTTALQALESAASAAATPASQGSEAPARTGGTGTPQGPAATTPQPAAPATAPTPPQSGREPGPIPFHAHQRALANARAEAAKQWAWAQGMNEAEVKQAMAVAARLKDVSTAREFYAQLGQELGQLDDEFPEPDYTDQTGGNKFYSAAAMRKMVDVALNRARREWQGVVNPLVEQNRQAEEERQFAEQQRVQQQQIGEALKHAETLPGFKENEAAISAEMEKLAPETVKRMGIIGAMYFAYSNFMAGHLPSLLAKEREAVHGGLKQAAAASQGQVMPTGNQPTGRPKSPSNERELAAHMEQKAREAGLS